MDVFVAISDLSRRKVLDLLSERERTAGELVEALSHLSQPAVSKHLRLLREAGLVEVRADGQLRVYSLKSGALNEVNAWLENHRRVFASRLDALEQHLAEVHGKKGSKREQTKRKTERSKRRRDH